MTLPSSGPITAEEIDKTLFRTADSTWNLGSSDGRALTGRTSGKISYSNFYGLTNTISTTYSTPGVFSYTVPNQVTSLTVQYVTPTGIVSNVITGLTPGSVISGTIGTYGNVSTFGSFVARAFDARIFTYSGVVDSHNTMTFSAITNTTTPVTYSANDNSTNINLGAAAVGINFALDDSCCHGDLGKNVILSPVPETAIYGGGAGVTRAYISGFSGRDQAFLIANFGTDGYTNNANYVDYVNSGTAYTPATGSVIPYPTISGVGAYDVTILFDDSGIPDQASYSGNINLQQVVPLTIIASA
jgi:hypothetical protein